MGRKLMIVMDCTGPIEAELTDENPQTADAIIAALPLQGRVNRWGDEIFFTLPFEIAAENGRKEVAVGEIAYWPDGDGFCVFFGRTPVSKSDAPMAYSPVNVFGKITGDPLLYLNAQTGDEIAVMAAEDYKPEAAAAAAAGPVAAEAEADDEDLFEWDD